MTSLPSLLGAMTAILQTHSLCKQITNVETKEFSADQFLFKILVVFSPAARQANHPGQRPG